MSVLTRCPAQAQRERKFVCQYPESHHSTLRKAERFIFLMKPPSRLLGWYQEPRRELFVEGTKKGIGFLRSKHVEVPHIFPQYLAR